MEIFFYPTGTALFPGLGSVRGAFGGFHPTATLARGRPWDIPSIVLGEYCFGIRQSRHRRRYEDWLHRYLPWTEIVAATQTTAGIHAEIRPELKQSGNPIPSNDAWIAALARQQALPVLRNDVHFNVVEGIERIAF